LVVAPGAGNPTGKFVAGLF